MNREIMDATELALANLLDVIPRLFNTGDEVDPVILRIYERNAAVLGQNDEHIEMHNDINNTMPWKKLWTHAIISDFISKDDE